MSSPRGFDAGGIGAIGTEVLRLDMRGGEGDLRGCANAVGDGGVGDGVVDGEGGELRGKKKENQLSGNLERNGGWRTLRYMLRLRSARLA